MLTVEWLAGLTGLGMLAVVVIGLWLFALVWEKLSNRSIETPRKYERARDVSEESSSPDPWR